MGDEGVNREGDGAGDVGSVDTGALNRATPRISLAQQVE
jgi:hypothetical protein